MTDPLSFPKVLDAIRDQTARLLGATIGFDEEEWAAKTSLPGWTKSHVAAHLVEGARNLTRLIDATGTPYAPVAESEQRYWLERRALNTGLALQIKLDESAGQLHEALWRLEHRTDMVQVAAHWRLPALEVPVIRLRELVVHHYDLVGEVAFDLPYPVLLRIASFEVARLRRHELPPVFVVADEGFSARIGSEDGETTTVIGPLRDLLLWIVRGVATEHVSGTAGVASPISS